MSFERWIIFRADSNGLQCREKEESSLFISIASSRGEGSPSSFYNQTEEVVNLAWNITSTWALSDLFQNCQTSDVKITKI